MLKNSVYANKEINLFGLNFTESASANNWASCTVETYKTIIPPKTCDELLKIPLENPHNFLMSMDKKSIDKEIANLGVEALMFWELPKVELALDNFL